MSALVLERSVIEKLKAVAVGVEVRDERGTLIGFFHPVVAPDNVDQYECPLSEEELDRRARLGGGRSLTEILGELKDPA
jgi:hypothetical protein